MRACVVGNSLVITDLEESDLEKKRKELVTLFELLANKQNIYSSDKIGVALMLTFAGCEFEQFDDFVFDEKTFDVFLKWLTKNNLLRLAEDHEPYLTKYATYRIRAGFLVERVKDEEIETRYRPCFTGEELSRKNLLRIKRGFITNWLLERMKQVAKEICMEYLLSS